MAPNIRKSNCTVRVLVGQTVAIFSKMCEFTCILSSLFSVSGSNYIVSGPSASRVKIRESVWLRKKGGVVLGGGGGYAIVRTLCL